MFYIYILYSGKLDRYYVGHTADLLVRLEQHKAGVSSFTAKATDWQIMYTEVFSTREQAHKREREIKAKKSRKYLRYLIEMNAG